VGEQRYWESSWLRDTFSPYVDNRPALSSTTERREYQAVYVQDDDEIGLRSDTAAGVFKA
jgi:hypothetical protein